MWSGHPSEGRSHGGRSALQLTERELRQHQREIATLECVEQPPRRITELVVRAAAQDRGIRVDPGLHGIILPERSPSDDHAMTRCSQHLRLSNDSAPCWGPRSAGGSRLLRGHRCSSALDARRAFPGEPHSSPRPLASHSASRNSEARLRTSPVVGCPMVRSNRRSSSSFPARTQGLARPVGEHGDARAPSLLRSPLRRAGP